MLHLQQILDANDPFFENVYNLYSTSFSVSDKRSRAGLERELTEKRFQSHAILLDNQFVGFINLWTFERFCFIEHFAIESDFRNQNNGSDIMKLLIAQVKLPIVLEIELPKTNQAIRRINFYERLGFFMLSNFYMQPPYENSMVLITKLIMSNDYNFVTSHFQTIKNTIYKEVYHYSNKI